LKEHIARTHPSLLPKFESGWVSLTPELKDLYLNPGFNERDFEERWEDWASSICRNKLWRDRKYREVPTSMLLEKMEHSGVLFGVQDEKLESWTESYLRQNIAKNALLTFQHHVMERAKDFLREILEKDGIETFRRFLARVPPINIDMKIKFRKVEPNQ
jgi:oligoribonuclease NrnB/cAMP/cGMP phosphodiesterase (DHH superfamily)